MTSTRAQYLIRFDDFCPTMLHDRAERFLSLISRYGVHPILAVIPDNRDPELNLQPADPEFWTRMRSLEQAGATIAMHGFRHLCISTGKSILGLHKESEFAGVDEIQQRQWIRCGLGILREHGLSPRLFVAPRHGFDSCTLSALAWEGLGILSDGFAHRPFMREDVMWIPQQLWEPVPKTSGLWTICIHTNTATTALEEKLEKFLAVNAPHFTDFNRIIEDIQPDQLHWTESIGGWATGMRKKLAGGTTRHVPSA
jgi:predicted deacetylase